MKRLKSAFGTKRTSPGDFFDAQRRTFAKIGSIGQMALEDIPLGRQSDFTRIAMLSYVSRREV
jgi:hypothetical protein